MNCVSDLSRLFCDPSIKVDGYRDAILTSPLIPLCAGVLFLILLFKSQILPAGTIKIADYSKPSTDHSISQLDVMYGKPRDGG